MADGTKEIDLMKILGALIPPSVQQFALYIPDKDKEGNKIRNLIKWIKEASLLLSIMGGGSTTMAPCGRNLVKERY